MPFLPQYLVLMIDHGLLTSVSWTITTARAVTFYLWTLKL